jgi:hypothetical protein
VTLVVYVLHRIAPATSLGLVYPLGIGPDERRVCERVVASVGVLLRVACHRDGMVSAIER